MKKTTLYFVSFFLLLFLCFIFLFATESGLVVIQKSVNRFGGGVSIGQVSGKLLGEWSLKRIQLLSADADIAVEQLEYSWRPASLLKAELNIAKLTVTGVDIVLKEDPDSTPDDESVQLPAELLPFSFLVESLAVKKLEIIDSDGESLLVIDSMLVNLEGNADRLTINEFDLQGPEIGLGLHGNIEVRKGWALELTGNWRLAGFGFQPMTGSLLATGPLSDPQVELGVHSPASIQIVADLVDLLDKPEWTAGLEAKDVDLSSLIVDCPAIELASITADFSGDFENYRGRVQAEGAWDTFEGLYLKSDLTGDLLGIDFQTLRIETKDSSVEAINGKIDWQDIFSWKGQFLFKNFDASAITEELQGRFTAELVSEGDVKENGVIASFEIVNLHGVFQDQNITVNGKVFLSETEVKTDGLTIRSGDFAGLALIERGSFSWAEELHWSGKIRLDQFDPSWLHPEFFGSVNAEVQGEGRLRDQGLEGTLNIKKLSGTLRDNELSGGGKISISGNSLQTKGLVLKSGLSELVVRGKAGDSLALTFFLSSPDIASILPETTGSILLQGSLGGTWSEPQIEAKIEGTGISYQENSLARVQAEIQTMLKGDGRLDGSLIVEKMSLDGFTVDKGGIALKGTLAEHEFTVDGAGAFGKLGLRAHGAYGVDGDEWQGVLSYLQLETLDHGVWRQEKPVTLTAGSNGVLLEELCLANKGGEVCLGGDVRLEKAISWTVHGKLISVPIQWLNRLGLITVPVNGEINAAIAANGDSRAVLSAKVESKVSDAALLMNVDETEQIPFYFDDSVLTLDLTDGLLQGNINIQMQNDSQLVLSVNVEGAGDYSAPLDSLPLGGHLDLKKFDLDLLSTFTGYGVEPSGWVNNSFTLEGTVGQPKIYGDISIEDGGIDLPYQGIILENIVLSIEAGEDDAKISGKATSGPGQLTATGTVRYGMKGIEGIVNVKGDDFLLVNLPEYAVRVKPDLLLLFENDTGELSGTVEIPYGLITPEEMSDSISVSEDVIIVNGTKEEQAKDLPFKLNLNVKLGDDVRIEGYGLTGKLEGELDVLTTQDNSLSGRGTLNLLGGTFAMYGQKLTIERGRVLFTGGPLDNPGIDVRAQRQITDKKLGGESYTVGIDISGFVQDLQYHLYSDPFMEDTEIISFMIVGRSLANSTEEEGNMVEAAAMMLGTTGSSGFVKDLGNFMLLDDLHFEGSSSKENMALVVGKRLTEDLYIGYDLNMFSQLGQFRVRYDLTRGFSVETTSSAESTGADLLYTFER